MLAAGGKVAIRHRAPVPELTGSFRIKINTRLRLPRTVAIVSSSQLRGVPKAMQPTPRNQGAPLQEGAAAPPLERWHNYDFK